MIILAVALVGWVAIVAGLAIWMDKRLRRLDQQLQNVQVEVFYPMAEAQGPDGVVKKRVTLHGAVKTLMAIAQQQNAPKVGKKIIHTPGAGKVIFTPSGAIQVQPAAEGPTAPVADHPSVEGTKAPVKLELAK